MQDTITPAQWSALVAEANEAAGDRFEPDWAVAYVEDPASRHPWRWYIALPMGSITEDSTAFVAHEGTARSSKAAVRKVGKHLAEYDGRVIGRDPHGQTLGAIFGSLLRVSGGLALAALLARLGAPPTLVWYLAAALVAVGLAVGLVRHYRALGYQPID